ncbi:MAG: tRNA (adenosine(37)-N6)-threonylcarbamoyltransferase complex ATPase subunit type 1 TsaE [Bacteroidales bacterium]|nr:tRNA (adenosine(37)-N6)-threonylcarbamoyltransferase complex ATPase subunit type 1 TsaE [Bacteroidales bacterium]
MAEIEIREINDLERSALEFLEHIGDASVIAFYGAMGAGKTTFITALCKVLGVKDVVNSPTFTIVNEYLSGTGRAIYHFDFYRINKLSEVMDIGFDEYIYSDGLCLIEWPEKIEELLPEDTLRVYMTVEGDDLRILNF